MSGTGQDVHRQQSNPHRRGASLGLWETGVVPLYHSNLYMCILVIQLSCGHEVFRTSHAVMTVSCTLMVPDKNNTAGKYHMANTCCSHLDII